METIAHIKEEFAKAEGKTEHFYIRNMKQTNERVSRICCSDIKKKMQHWKKK